MPFYFYEGSYAGETWARLVAEPRDLAEIIRPTIEKFGGRVVACMLSLEHTEPFGFVEFPDDISAAAWCMFMLSQRGVKTVRMTQMISTEDGVESMRKVGAASSPPLGIW